MFPSSIPASVILVRTVLVEWFYLAIGLVAIFSSRRIWRKSLEILQVLYSWFGPALLRAHPSRAFGSRTFTLDCERRSPRSVPEWIPWHLFCAYSSALAYRRGADW